jgi:hypothetical protein
MMELQKLQKKHLIELFVTLKRNIIINVCYVDRVKKILIMI